MGRTGVVYKQSKLEIESLETYSSAKAKALLETHGEEWLTEHILQRSFLRLREHRVQPIAARIGESSLFDAMCEALDPDTCGFGSTPVITVESIDQDACYHTFTSERVALDRSNRGADSITLGDGIGTREDVRERSVFAGRMAKFEKHQHNTGSVSSLK